MFSRWSRWRQGWEIRARGSVRMYLCRSLASAEFATCQEKVEEKEDGFCYVVS